MNAVSKDVIPNSVTIGRPDPQHGTFAAQALKVAEAFVVNTAETAAIATDELRSIVARKKQLEEQRVGITKPINEALRNVNTLFKGPTDLLEAAERMLKSKLLTFQQAEERKRIEAQAAAEAAARKEAERLEREATKLEAKGKVEQAAAKREVAATIPMPVVAPVEKPTGFTARRNWKARTKGDNWKRELIAHIAGVPVEKLARPDLDFLFDLNEQKAHAIAKQCEKADLGIPGLEGFNDQVAAIR